MWGPGAAQRGPRYIRAMVTDPLPRAARLRKQYEASDALTTLALPDTASLQRLTSELGQALAGGERVDVKKTGTRLLELLATFYGVTRPRLEVLGSRPLKVIEGHLSYELFGDYTPGTQTIRVWMRTAVLGKVTSHRGLLNTLLHEFCHHLDVTRAAAARHPPHPRVLRPDRRPLPPGPGHPRRPTQAAGLDQAWQHLAHRLAPHARHRLSNGAARSPRGALRLWVDWAGRRPSWPAPPARPAGPARPDVWLPGCAAGRPGGRWA